MEKQVDIPKLRFPVFTGEWEKLPIGSFIDLLSGYAFKGDEISEDNNGKPLLRGINISEGFIRHNSEIDRYYSGDYTKLNKYLLKENDLVIGMDGSKVGKNVALISKEDKDSLLIQRVARIRSNRFSDIRYIYQHIFSNLFRDYVDVVNTSSGIPHISAQQIKDFVIGFPTLPEQTKIANFLSAVDDKLTQLKKKKSLLEQYKKGVMQKIFSQELRFRDENGENFVEWEEKKIKEVFRFKQGVQCGVDNQYSEKGENMQRFIRIIDLTSINEPIRYIDSPSSEHHIKPDDLFMVRYGTPGLVGYGYEGIIANNLFRIIPVKKVVNKFYYFVFNYLSQELSNLASSSTMPALSFGSLEVLSVPEPSLPEQTKIANFLSAIDAKISYCGMQIEKMEGWKKGLLQQMFV